jgi:hypothetical protein
MVTLEQVKLLETKVIRAVEYVERLSRENAQLEGKVDSYQKRIGDLEVLIQKFKEDQERIEEGILSSLDRLNQFEDAIEQIGAGPPRPPAAPGEKVRREPEGKEPGGRETDSPRPGPEAGKPDAPAPLPAASGEEAGAPARPAPRESPEGLFPGESGDPGIQDAGSGPELPGTVEGPDPRLGLGQEEEEEDPPEDSSGAGDSAELDIF